MPSYCYSTQYVRWWERSELIQVTMDAIEERQRDKIKIANHGKSEDVLHRNMPCVCFFL